MEPTTESLGCLEIYWVLRAPKGVLLHCTLHQVGKVYEVRVGFGLAPPLRTQHAFTINAAAVSAEKFKKLALSIGYIERYRSADAPTTLSHPDPS